MTIRGCTSLETKDSIHLISGYQCLSGDGSLSHAQLEFWDKWTTSQNSASSPWNWKSGHQFWGRKRECYGLFWDWVRKVQVCSRKEGEIPQGSNWLENIQELATIPYWPKVLTKVLPNVRGATMPCNPDCWLGSQRSTNFCTSLWNTSSLSWRKLVASHPISHWLSFQDGIRWLRNLEPSEGKVRDWHWDALHGTWERQIDLWILLLRDLVWGKPQQEVIPGHMTMCNISLGFTMCVDQADYVNCLYHNWDCSKNLLPACRYQWDMAGGVWCLSVVFSLLILSSSPRSVE